MGDPTLHDDNRDWNGGVRRALGTRGTPRRSAAAQGAALKRRLVGCGMAQVRREVTPLIPVEWHRELQRHVEAFDSLLHGTKRLLSGPIVDGTDSGQLANHQTSGTAPPGTASAQPIRGLASATGFPSSGRGAGRRAS